MVLHGNDSNLGALDDFSANLDNSDRVKAEETDARHKDPDNEFAFSPRSLAHPSASSPPPPANVQLTSVIIEDTSSDQPDLETFFLPGFKNQTCILNPRRYIMSVGKNKRLSKGYVRDPQ